MAFIVKATGIWLSDNWLATATASGFCTVGPRTKAAVFPTRAAAQLAADNATKSRGSVGLTFTVEASH